VSAHLDIQHVSKAYGDKLALRDVSLAIHEGAIVCLLGPSGCGKTTLLRSIAGLEQPDSGAISFAGQRIDQVPPHERGFGLMFQDYALFPHRNVAENIGFGLRMQGKDAGQIAERVQEMLSLVGLQGYERRRVYELSGGERQRVALARSLAPSPRLLMLDEPLGALDRSLRERLQDELRDILKRVGVTSVYVTHDQSEAFALADWLVLMNAGQIEQQGPPSEMYRQPVSQFAARFLGHDNLVAGQVLALEQQGTVLVNTPVGPLRTSDPSGVAYVNAPITAVIRPEAARMLSDPQSEGINIIHGTVLSRSFRGSHTRIVMQHASGKQLAFELDTPSLPAEQEAIVVELRAEAISLIAD
jgi:ABC-type Fe3+/spermidine/putrescine transport system ATPase subunit